MTLYPQELLCVMQDSQSRLLMGNHCWIHRLPPYHKIRCYHIYPDMLLNSRVLFRHLLRLPFFSRFRHDVFNSDEKLNEHEKAPDGNDGL